MLRFDGRVVLVTGAGGGLGREYALLFAERGACVVVNDLGGSSAGTGSGTRAADLVVNEIRAKGGKAVPNYDSVEEAGKLIQTAISNYNRIDIVVNNAGILRDKAFRNMSNEEWDIIHRIHLRAAFLVAKAAWPHMRERGFGRIINTASNSGIYGNFGQANYSAAKLGLVGLTNTLAREGEKYGIHVMSVVPTAASRLTAPLMPEEVLNALHPRHVAPLVVWLCHEDCQETGGVYEACAGWFGRLKWYRSPGKKLAAATGQAATPEQVRDNWDAIVDMSSGAETFANMDEAMTVPMDEDSLSTAPVQSASSAAVGKSAGGPRALVGYRYPSVTSAYGEKDVMLYAAGIGCTVTDSEDLQFLYENHERFAPFPTFAIVASTASMGRVITELPGLEFNPAKLLHGEQFLEVLAPMASSGTVTIEPIITDVVDKGKGALVVLNTDGIDNANGEKLFRAQAAIFLRGAGGFGGPRQSNALVPLGSDPPARPPDVVVTQKTSREQAVIYRLASGDYNPLHIDPEFSSLGGFPVPIMHGLCSFGYVVRHALKAFGGNDPANFKAVKVRFNGPVVPGETILTKMWQAGGAATDRVLFQAEVKDTGKPIITGGFVDFQPGTLAKFGKSDRKPSIHRTMGHSVTEQNGNLNSIAIFDEVKARVAARPEMVKKVNAISLWIITKDGKEVGKFTVDLKNEPGAVYSGEPRSGARPGVTPTLADETMLGLASGELNPQKAFMQGKMKIKGNLMLTQKLQAIMREESKM
jgi:3-hydroxyacyl-CoA dehydrogenase/3a,7a,12a-trihydroxy-5b-cholest-24-enoyl-CoA hydratase